MLLRKKRMVRRAGVQGRMSFSDDDALADMAGLSALYTERHRMKNNIFSSHITLTVYSSLELKIVHRNL